MSFWLGFICGAISATIAIGVLVAIYIANQAWH